MHFYHYYLIQHWKKVIFSIQDKNLGAHLGDNIGATQIDVVSFRDGPKPDIGSKEVIVI